MQKHDVTTAIIKNNEGEILLVKRARMPFEGVWSLVSGIGASREGLRPDDAVIGEVKYDLGVNFSGKLLFTMAVTDDEFTDRVHVYLGTVSSDNIVLNPKAATEFGWFSFEEIARMEILGFQHREILEIYLKTDRT